LGTAPKPASSYHVIRIQDSFEPTTETAPYFMGRCPKDCLLYRAPWRARLSRWRRNQHPVIWFERQPWQVKVALIAAIVAASILLAASYFGVVRDLTTLVRAIGEGLARQVVECPRRTAAEALPRVRSARGRAP
jgi:hypothetical protein